MLPRGTTRKFENRIAWTITYLSKARLLDRVARGVFRISERGSQVLQKDPTELNNNFLRQFPEFVEFTRGTRIPAKKEDELEEDNAGTPFETLEVAYQSLRKTLAQDRLARIGTCSPKFFETLVIDLLVAIGYGGSRKNAGQAVGVQETMVLTGLSKKTT